VTPDRASAAATATVATALGRGIAGLVNGLDPDQVHARYRAQFEYLTPIFPQRKMVLETEGAVIGFAYAKPFADRPTFRWTLETNVYVAAGHQRRGGGRDLYGALLARLARRGYHRVVASIVLPNDPAIALHEAAGFHRAGSFEKIGWKLGQWHDAVLFQRDLVPDDGTVPGSRTADAELQGLLTPEPLEVTRTPLLRPHPAEDLVAYFGD